MLRSAARRSIEPLARRLLAAACLWLAMGCAGVASASESAAQLLREADALKTSRYIDFVALMEQLEARDEALAADEAEYLRYLRAWQRAYVGDYPQALESLQDLADSAAAPLIRFRALASMVNVLTIVRRYQPAYEGMAQMLERLPEIDNAEAREQALLTAAQIHIQVGQFDLALRYLDTVLAESLSDRVQCRAMQVRLDALYQSAVLRADDPQHEQAWSRCANAEEWIFASLVRSNLGRVLVREGRYADALTMLNENYAQALETRYARLMSDFESLLAQAYWALGDTAQAEHFAQLAIAHPAQLSFAEPLLVAHRVLYEISKQRGDAAEALLHHERWSSSDKAAMDDSRARQLAYQMVSQQVIADRMEIEALNRQNELLRLEQQLADTAVENMRLYGVLLLMGLAFVALWAVRTKRSEAHFIRLARHDGLTGLFNRQHFVNESSAALVRCRSADRPAALIMMDVDHFKYINDLHGHAVGDEVLAAVAAALRSCLGDAGILGRIGGEEFAVLLPGLDADAGMVWAERLRQAVASVPGEYGGEALKVTASFGVVASEQSGFDLKNLLSHGDAAMYDAKRQGRNRIIDHRSLQKAEAASAASAAEAQITAGHPAS